MQCPRCGKPMVVATARSRSIVHRGAREPPKAGWVCSDVACPGKL